MRRRVVQRLCAFALGAGLLAAGLTPVFAQSSGGPHYVYDDLGRLVAVIDPLGDAVTYHYDSVGNLLSISRQSSSLVSIIEFRPKCGSAGTSVTIYGTGFSDTASLNTVTFNGVGAPVLSATVTQIVTTVPAGATTGPITVTTPTGAATSTKPFSVDACGGPTITGFTPTIGAPGTAVTITGTNFEPVAANNKVTFNTTRSTVSSSTTTSIATTVPSKATSGHIAVATPSGKAVSSGDFFVPPSPYTAADVEVTGRMAIGGSKTVTIGTATKIALIVFDGTAGQRVSLLLSSVTITFSTVSILNPDGTTLGSAFLATFGAFMEPKTLPTTGTYTILVELPNPFTGSVTLTLYDVPPDVTGTITPGGPSVTVTTTTPGQNALLTFSGTAGQRVSLAMTNVTFGLRGFCNLGIAIFNPDGTTLASLCMAGTSGFIDANTLPVTGTYTILIDPPGTSTGSVTLTLYDVPPDVTGTITPGGPSVTVTTTTPGQNALLTFSGVAGQRVSLLLSSVTIGVSNVSILNPDGTRLGLTGVGSGGAFIDTMTLPTMGTYTILVQPFGTTGSLTLTLYDVQDVTGTITPGGPSVTVTTTTPGQNALLTFSGVAGQRVSLLGTGSLALLTFVSILNPDGTTLVSPTTLFFDAKTLPTTGTYTIVIDPITTVTGSLTLTLYDVPPDVTGTITIGGPSITVTTTTPGQNALLTFSGTAGQQITVRVTGNTIGLVTVKLLKPDGTTLTSSFTSSSSFNLATQTLPTTGTYTISIDPYDVRTGSLSVQVTSP